MSWFVLHPPVKVDVVSFFVTAGLLTAGAQRGTMLRLLDDAASRAREVGRRLLLVIDGLDEDRSADRGRSSIAALLPRRPPPEVRVLVASRPHPRSPVTLLMIIHYGRSPQGNSQCQRTPAKRNVAPTLS